MITKFKIAYAYLDGILKINESDAHILTHINIAFGLIGPDGLLNTDGLRYMEQVRQIRAWNPDIKIVLSVGGWGAGGFSEMARTEEGRRAFARSCVEYIEAQEEKGILIDGIDIDWEYPGIGWSGIVADSADKINYTLLLQQLRQAIGEEKILSVAVGAGEFFIANTEMRKVAEVCDYVQLMTYDMRAEGCFVAGHHTALYASDGDTEGKSVHDNVRRFIEAGVPVEKMIIGAAFYSRIWRGLKSKERNGLLQPSEADGVYGYSYTQLVNDFIDKNGYVRYRDDVAKAPYLFNGTDFISYDDPESIAEKCKYITDNGLLGIMYWEHGCDETHELIKSMS